MLKGRYQLLKGYENNHVTIGFGSYGQVKLAKNADSGQIVAVKIINKLAKNEIVFHNQLSHSKIIKLLDYQIDREKQITYMVLEYADDGTLFEKIKTIQVPKKQIKSFFKDVCLAVAYLHGKQIMHRDIKPENILLTKKGEAKLCDFGFAAILGERKTLCGTYQYMSPEMISNKPYDFKIDIWALGILLFQMISGQAPFRGESPEEVLQQMKTKIFFCERFDADEINLIRTILRVTPNKRPTVFEILEHPYFTRESKSSESSETKQSFVKKIHSVSSNANIGDEKSEKVIPKTFQFQKRQQKPDGAKHPQNSFPFFIPKTKIHTGGSTGSNGNSSQAQKKVIMPEYTSVKYQNKSKLESPIKKQPTDKDSTSNLKPEQKFNNKKIPNAFKCKQEVGQQQAQKLNKNSGFNSMIGVNKEHKTLNFSMGNNYKARFASLHGEQINALNLKQIEEDKIASPQGRNKTFFYPGNKPTTNRLS